MKTIKEIRHSYAIQQGYDSWYSLLLLNSANRTIKYIEETDRLIQDELKKKIADRFNGGFERCRIIETEIL